MPPVERPAPRFAAEPPQEGLPYGRWAERLGRELLGACLALAQEHEDLGEPGTLVWFPDRSWHGHTYVPATASTSGGYELFGYVRFVPSEEEEGEPSGFSAYVDFTEETAAANPQWTLDLCDEVVGRWRGPGGAEAAMTLVWGRPLVAGGAVVTAELGIHTVDQCELLESRFTLLAPDDFRHDLLEIALWSTRGRELARESLYAGEEGEGEGEGEGDDSESDEDDTTSASD
jgi:hypothetical protein